MMPVRVTVHKHGEKETERNRHAEINSCDHYNFCSLVEISIMAFNSKTNEQTQSSKSGKSAKDTSQLHLSQCINSVR